jgi:membrane-associated protein
MNKYLKLAVAVAVLAVAGAGFYLVYKFDLQTLITTVGVIGVISIIFAESGLLIGFFLPGDSLLFTAGFLTQQDVLGINIHLLVLLLFIAAAAGDSTGYAFGHKVGRHLFRRKESLLFQPANLERAEQFYEKNGQMTIVLARFIPIIRTFAPIVAGIGKMQYRTFLAYNIIGALIWAVGITYLGYYVGAWFEARGINIDHYLLPILAVIIVISFLPPVIHILKDADNRKHLASHAKKQLHRYKNR